ncbi:uncharacterized protein [Diabrotica undecimpunctata]|uniref:uncharacterized protein n=1 Tax=Diabrotica undecimpunctata TaxID=50387 RepID=UPI003B63C6E6
MAHTVQWGLKIDYGQDTYAIASVDDLAILIQDHQMADRGPYPDPIRPRSCIIHSNRVDCTLIPVLCTDDIVTAVLTITTEVGEKKLVVCSAYFPGDEALCPPSIISDIVAYCLEKGLQLIIGCDANAHHTVWGSKNINARGNKPTFVTKARKEVLDLTLCTSRISDIITNWVVSDEPSCLDYRHIRFDLDIFPSEIKYRNPRDTNWVGYRESLSKNLEECMISFKSPEVIDSAAETISEAIMAAYQENCPEKTRKSTGSNTVWWNNGLKKMRSEVRSLFNKAKSNQDWDAYRYKLTLYNKEIRKAKRPPSWQRMVLQPKK